MNGNGLGSRVRAGYSQTMPNLVVIKVLGRVPGLRRMPVAKLLVIGELALLAQEHVGRLEPAERRRVIQLMRRARGRPSKLSRRDRAELAALVAKANPRLFVGTAADKLSPVRLPRRVVRGPRRRV